MMDMNTRSIRGHRSLVAPLHFDLSLLSLPSVREHLAYLDAMCDSIVGNWSCAHGQRPRCSSDAIHATHLACTATRANFGAHGLDYFVEMLILRRLTLRAAPEEESSMMRVVQGGGDQPRLLRGETLTLVPLLQAYFLIVADKRNPDHIGSLTSRFEASRREVDALLRDRRQRARAEQTMRPHRLVLINAMECRGCGKNPHNCTRSCCAPLQLSVRNESARDICLTLGPRPHPSDALAPPTLVMPPFIYESELQRRRLTADDNAASLAERRGWQPRPLLAFLEVGLRRHGPALVRPAIVSAMRRLASSLGAASPTANIHAATLVPPSRVVVFAHRPRKSDPKPQRSASAGGGMPSKGGMLMSAERIRFMRNATFCVCPPGDFPYMQRFYQALLSLCIPVVFTFPSHTYNTTGEVSWHRHGGAAVADSHPFPWHIDWARAVLQVEFAKVVGGALERQILEVTNAEVAAKRAYIRSIRHLLQYDVQYEAGARLRTQHEGRMAVLRRTHGVGPTSSHEHSLFRSSSRSPSRSSPRTNDALAALVEGMRRLTILDS